MKITNEVKTKGRSRTELKIRIAHKLFVLSNTNTESNHEGRREARGKGVPIMRSQLYNPIVSKERKEWQAQ